ncbi:MAG TPA: hypothetical protein VK501_14390 [Baekduia sp.]|uniref:hypothetical protein n=1 Tax=Baekduia sp. TaxID=2600305 RepID=UPI002B875C0B|nr:hypothetical protein [Baekduia sp.]HMJ35096.1 hypothetical protein [Baekduia sp.]
MPRFPKRVLALGGLAAAGAAVLRRRRAGRPGPPSPSASPPASGAPPVPTAGPSAQASAVAPPPVEAPGPSVTPPGRAATPPLPPDAEILQGRRQQSSDALVDEETRLAAAEAAGIGGPGVDDAHGDPAMEAVYEGGGGEAEGFELSEEELIENASHGDGRADPTGDAFTPEIESDEATAVDGEADEEVVSETDPELRDR